MAKLNTPKGKLVRKLGVNIFGNPKFDRLLSKKGYGPGQHGKSGKRFSTYSVQLQEKQKIKFTYGMLEKQFRNYFEKASQMKGETGLNLLVMLESRLDNVIWELGVSVFSVFKHCKHMRTWNLCSIPIRTLTFTCCEIDNTCFVFIFDRFPNFECFVFLIYTYY